MTLRGTAACVALASVVAVGVSGCKDSGGSAGGRYAPPTNGSSQAATGTPAPADAGSPPKKTVHDPGPGGAVASINGHVLDNFKTSCRYGKNPDGDIMGISAEGPDHYQIDMVAHTAGDLLSWSIGQQGVDLGDKAWYVGWDKDDVITSKLDGNLVRVTGASTFSVHAPDWADAQPSRPAQLRVTFACPAADYHKWTVWPQ